MNQIHLPLDINSLEITGQSIDAKGNIILDVVSKKARSACHRCGKPATKRNGNTPTRLIRHLPILDTPVYLRITLVRYSCEYCDDHPTTTEQYDWCDRNATTTKGLEEYLMRQLIHSTIDDVAKKEKISSRVVQTIVDRQIQGAVDWEKVGAITTLGIDEIALKKGHHAYVTIISGRSDENQLFILAILLDRSKEQVALFLESIPDPIKKHIKSVYTDIHEGFVNAATTVFGVQSLVIDRYHVAKLYRKPLDKLRIKEMTRLKNELSEQEYTWLEGVMWTLRKKYECLNKEDKIKLRLLFQHSPALKKTHRFALKLTQIFNTHCSRKSGMAKINRWIRSVENSNLNCFNKFLVTLKKYQPYIANYFKKRKNSGFVEGLNNKIKVVKRRCYGLAKPTTLFQRLFLDLQGYHCYA